MSGNVAQLCTVSTTGFGFIDNAREPKLNDDCANRFAVTAGVGLRPPHTRTPDAVTKSDNWAGLPTEYSVTARRHTPMI